MFSKRNISFLPLLVALAVVHYMTLAEGAPQPSPEFYSPQLSFERNPEYLLQTLARLRQALVAEEDLENLMQKRSAAMVDFGMDRGRSGFLEAQHRLAFDYANSPSGPGKKKRAVLVA
ncbi:diuretic hormone class 2 isoform X1 [Agrilus planipennis]|uniref:Diuretic hormone class 2 isoform X1 n=1 Tax=Agrilus planipennis TaxID=224129 RepID=A0A7F5RNN8_AGRPL|nr:diuretic hormone class 2 isoform X1 [Agrilus planipennis]